MVDCENIAATEGTQLAWFDGAALNQLTETAALSLRKRAHLLLHNGPDDQVQRLLIAAQPGTYVRPHQHTQQWEMLVLMQGRLDVLILKADGRLISRHRMSQSTQLLQIPVSVWHSCAVCEPNTVVLEIKPGPYRPNEFAPWSAQEETPEGADLQVWLANARPGETWDRTKCQRT
jgi:cupin fold WbuC family metalloprotein